MSQQKTSDYWLEVTCEDAIRQGDILRRRLSSKSDGYEWAFVVTADCDIAQDKAGGHINYISIVEGRKYLADQWAPIRLSRFIDKQSNDLASYLTAHIHKLELDGHLTSDSLVSWLRYESVEEVAASLQIDQRTLAKGIGKRLEALRIAVSETEALSCFQKVRKLMGDSVETVQGLIKEALLSDKGFPDYFLIPEIPHAPGIGFVALLRTMSSIQVGDVYLNEVDARVADSPNSYHRVARSSDRIRFAIIQRLSFLFSRIGLPSHFEATCSSASELISELVLERE